MIKTGGGTPPPHPPRTFESFPAPPPGEEEGGPPGVTKAPVVIILIVDVMGVFTVPTRVGSGHSPAVTAFLGGAESATDKRPSRK